MNSGADQLERLEFDVWHAGESEWRRVQCPAHGYDGRLRTCKRRSCPRCGGPWSRDQGRKMGLAFALPRYIAKHGWQAPVILVSVTAPGAGVLPWDEEACQARYSGRRHRHSGPRGCRVDAEKAAEWASSLNYRWGKLRKAASLATQRALKDGDRLGPAPRWLGRVWEPQKRGVPHAHLVLGYATDAEQRAADEFVEQLRRLAADYEFGIVHSTKQIAGAEASRYLVSYLSGRNGQKQRKSTIRENIADPTMPRQLVWISPALTSTSTSERMVAMRAKFGVRVGTGVTMRWLRKARQLWGAFEGRCAYPTFRSTEEAVRAASVYLQAFRKRPPPDLDLVIREARKLDRSIVREGRWYQFEQQWKQQLEWAFLAIRATNPITEGGV